MGRRVFNGEEVYIYGSTGSTCSTVDDSAFDWMKRVQGEIHPLILSSIFHYEFVFIHPFSDGNGRMARLWHTAILSKWESNI